MRAFGFLASFVAQRISVLERSQERRCRAQAKDRRRRLAGDGLQTDPLNRSSFVDEREEVFKKAFEGEKGGGGLSVRGFVEDALNEVGEGKGGLMDGGVVVFELSRDAVAAFFNEVSAGVKLFGDHREAPPARRIGQHGGEVELGVGEDGLEVLVDLFDLFGVDEGGLALHDNDALVAESAFAIAKEFLCDQSSGGADRIGGIDKDDIIRVDAFLEEDDAIAKVHGDAGVGQSGADRGEEFLREADDLFIEFDKVDGFDLGIAEKFANGSAVTAADHEDALGIGVAAHGGMGEHLVVQKFVALGEHDAAIEDHHTSHPFGLKEHDLLIGGLDVTERTAYADLDAEVVLSYFVKPEV